MKIFHMSAHTAFTWVYMLALIMFCEQSVSSLSKGMLYEQFLGFATEYKKPYLSNSTEFLLRFDIFKENVERAKQLNRAYNASQSAVYGVNKFADLTPQEFKAQYLSGFRISHAVKSAGNFKPSVPVKDVSKLGLPQKVDWRLKKAVSPIKDQGQCGACWSFSSVETVESMYAIQFNTTAPKLSVQEVIDCDTGGSGCNGGDICVACEWMSRNGLVSDSQYPLTNHNDRCKELPESLQRVVIKSYTCASYKDQESGILELLAEHGPVAVGVDAATWHNYVGGIIQYHCSTHDNHAVQIIGYDLTGDVPYYIVRNSWGSDFGDKGYVYIKYGDNMCGVTEEVASVTSVTVV